MADSNLKARKIVRGNHTTVLEFPAPPQTFLARDLPSEKARRVHRRLMETDAVEVVDSHVDRGVKSLEWRLSPKAVEWAKKVEDSEGLLPCGHDGFVNEGNELRCKRCEETHAKEAVQA